MSFSLQRMSATILNRVVVVVAVVLSIYIYQCGLQKVCGVPILDSIVRNHIQVVAPLGTIDAEVAQTSAARRLGLSGRTSLSSGKGMMFIFETPGKYGFWMKDMKFDLDIMWIDEEGRIVTIERDVTPDTYPATFINSVNAVRVLELPAGSAEKYGLFLGSKVSFID